MIYMEEIGIMIAMMMMVRLKVPQKIGRPDRRFMWTAGSPAHYIQCDGGFYTQAFIDLAVPSHQAKGYLKYLPSELKYYIGSKNRPSGQTSCADCKLSYTLQAIRPSRA